MMMLLSIFFSSFSRSWYREIMQKLIIKNSTLNYFTIWNAQFSSDFDEENNDYLLIFCSALGRGYPLHTTCIARLGLHSSSSSSYLDNVHVKYSMKRYCLLSPLWKLLLFRASHPNSMHLCHGYIVCSVCSVCLMFYNNSSYQIC